MTTELPHHAPLFALAGSWIRLERRLDLRLSGLHGLSFAEYRILRAIADGEESAMSRAELAERVGLSASGVTRALGPLERRRIVSSVRSPRDARLSLARLTFAGRTLVDDAARTVEELMESLLEDRPGEALSLGGLIQEMARS